LRRPLGQLLLATLLLAAPARLLGQGGEDEVTVHAYALSHQSAGDAMGLVKPLLSPRGTVELQPRANALVVRDTDEAWQRIRPVLVAFDHPPRPVDVELWVVRASGRSQVSPQPPPQGNLPADLLRALSERLPFEHYGLLGSSEVRGEEGKRMTFDIAGNYTVKFRLGTIVQEQRLRLNDFEVILRPDGGDPASILRSQLNLWLGRTMVLALSPGEGSNTALMVVVRCNGGTGAARATPRPRAPAPGSKGGRSGTGFRRAPAAGGPF
jgi:hypothetical protein